VHNHILKRGSIFAAIAGLLISGILPASNAATLRVPKNSWQPCVVQNGIYCIEAISVTTPGGKIVPLQWVPSGQAVPAASANNGISFAPVAKVINGVVTQTGWWTDQYQRDVLTSGTTTYMDISALIDTATYPEQGAKYDSTTKLFDVTRPQDAFAFPTACWNSTTKTSTQVPWDQCFKGGMAAIKDGEVAFIFNYNTAALAAAAVKDFSTAKYVDLKELASKGQQPSYLSKYDVKTGIFSKLEPLYTPVWVTNKSLINGWDVAGTPATLPTVAVIATPTPTTTDTATPAPIGTASATPSTNSSVVTTNPSLPDPNGVVPAPLAPNAATTVASPVEPGRALTGRWTSPLWNSLGFGSLGYDGLFVDAKAANEFVNHVLIDVVPTLTSSSYTVNLASQTGSKGYAVSLDSDITISVKVRTGDIQTGVTVAVGVDTTVTTEKLADYSTLTVEGSAVSVPLAKTAADCSGESGVAKALVRQFQTLIVEQSDTSGFGVDGTSGNMYVGSNGICSLSTPTWDSGKKAFTWVTAAPHFAPDGTTVNTGFYKAVIPYKDAALLWGLTNPADAATALAVSVSTESGGSTAAVSVVSAKNGNIIIDISGFQFSRPRLSITIKKGYKASKKKLSSLPAPKYTVTCALGASTKKVTGTKPACPRGYKQVGAKH
jgi:hypothetical protein